MDIKRELLVKYLRELITITAYLSQNNKHKLYIRIGQNEYEFMKALVKNCNVQPAFTCSNSTMETPEQCVKSVQS